MSTEASTKEATDFPKQNWGWILIILSVLADTLTLIQWLQGSKALSTVVFLVIFTSVLWLSLFYIYFKTKKVGELHSVTGSEPRPVKKPLYPKWARHLALAGIIAVPVFSFTGFAIWKYIKSQPSDKIIILVADFEGPEPQNYRVTETILENLREATKEYDDVRVQALDKAITAQEGSNVARAKGKEHKASIMLWGWYGKTQAKAIITAHFEVLQKPNYLSLNQEKQVLTMTVAELDSFKIQAQLSSEINYLTLLTVGLVRYEAQDYDGALFRFNDALNHPNVPAEMVNPAVIHFYRATANIFKKEFKHAIVDYNQAIKLNPIDADSYNNRGVAYLVKDNIDSAIFDFTKAIEYKTNNTIALSNRGSSYIIKGNLDNAKIDFDQVIQYNPNDAVAYTNRGIIYIIKREYGRAIADFDSAILHQSDMAEAYCNRGVTYADSGLIDPAISDYTQALTLNPNLLAAYYSRGNAYAAKGNYNQAIVDYSRAINLRSVYVDAYNNRASAYIKKGNYDLAISDCDSAIKFEPDFPLAYCNRGKAFFLKNDYDLAIADYNRGIKLKDDDAEAYILRGVAYYNKRNYKQSLADLDQAIKLKSDDPAAYHIRGAIYHNKGLFDFAITDYTWVIKLKPKDAEAYYNRGLAHKIKGNKNNAIADFKNAFDLTSDPNRRQQIKQWLQELGVNISQK